MADFVVVVVGMKFLTAGTVLSAELVVMVLKDPQKL
jgi:hypothetical protein